jgi:hypothetical protein
MSRPPASGDLARLRLAAQRLLPGTEASDPAEAGRAVLGIQAQDVRAAGLALRLRVPGLTREQVDGSGMVRTWTVRGTAHLLDPGDLGPLHALTGPRFRRYIGGLMAKRGDIDGVRALLSDAVELLEPEPLSRADLLVALRERGHPQLDQSSANILMPWIAYQGLIAGLPDGRFRAADPPDPVEEEEALAWLGRRYLEGYGPAGVADLAKWSGLGLGICRRALEAAAADNDLESAGELWAVAGGFDPSPERPARAQLLAAFDTAMLGWADRGWLVSPRHATRAVPGGGIIRAVVLAGGRAVGTWKLTGSGRRRRLGCDWFGRKPAAAALAKEAADAGRFLGVEVA